jgi:hypothetical protein
MAKRFPLGNEWLARFRFALVLAARNDERSGRVTVDCEASSFAIEFEG